MITLLAESKNMASGNGKHTLNEMSYPVFKEEADVIADLFAKMPVEEIAQRYEVSMPLAAKAKRMFYDFQNPLTKEVALKAFTGEVFMGLNISSLSEGDMEFAYRKVGIISSLYGYLQAADVINPYRFDYYVENPMTCEKMQDFWKPRVTDFLVNLLNENDEREILDLLPEAAAKCIDWNEVRKHADVSKVSFKTISDGGKMKTPYSWKIKDLRGKLLREILIGKIDSIAEVLTIQTPVLALSDNSTNPLSPTFLTI